MTATFEFDRLLESVLDADGPQAVPPTVVEAALTKSRAFKQRRPRVSALDRQAWPARHGPLRSGSRTIPSPLARVLLMALIATALIALGVVGSALLREPSVPKQLNSTFVHHFEYAMPADSAMRLSATSRFDMVAWVDGPDVWPIASDEEAVGGVHEPQPGQVRGVVVGSAVEPWSHGAEGRFMLRTAPAEFLADLRDTAGSDMGVISATRLDGRPALTATLVGTGGSDIHVTGRMLGPAGVFVQVTMPSRLVVSEVDGSTIFILTWARTAQELERWLPFADEFVESIHFVPD